MGNDNKPAVMNNKNEQRQKILAYVKFAVLLLILVGIPLYIYFFQHQLIDSVNSVEKVQRLLNDNKAYSIPIYILAQIIQIVICIIPGQWLQMGAGLAWGVMLGLLFSLIGAFFGSLITYYIAKWLGKDAVHFFFGEEKVAEYVEKLNSKRAFFIVFLIFLIPGVPKDLCNYAAGISSMRLKPFMLASMIGRTPGMLGSIIIGKRIAAADYTVAIIIAVVAVIIAVLGVIFHKRILDFIEKKHRG